MTVENAYFSDAMYLLKSNIENISQSFSQVTVDSVPLPFLFGQPTFTPNLTLILN